MAPRDYARRGAFVPGVLEMSPSCACGVARANVDFSGDVLAKPSVLNRGTKTLKLLQINVVPSVNLQKMQKKHV